MNDIFDERKNDLLTLFTPGDGGQSLSDLAGRKSEKKFFELSAYMLMKKHRRTQNMIVFGPRGNGKTSLLDNLAVKARKQYGDDIEVLWTTPSEIRTSEKLEHWIKFEGRNATPVVQEIAGNAGAWLVEGKANLKIERPDGIKIAIRERCASKPVILIVDEAHRLNETTAEDLLNASQAVRRESIPFFLVLAGTPGLMKTLGQAEASFWERGKVFPLGRLSLQESVEALTKPIVPLSISFAKGVAEEVACKAHCYPFFIQLWGQCLMEELVDSEQTVIGPEMVLGAEPKVKARTHQMYTIRYTELDDLGLLSVAGAIARAFIANDNNPIPTVAIDKLIGDKGSIKTLENLGYIWRLLRTPEEKLSYEPGIPSLMGFIKEQTEDSHVMIDSVG